MSSRLSIKPGISYQTWTTEVDFFGFPISAQAFSASHWSFCFQWRSFVSEAAQFAWLTDGRGGFTNVYYIQRITVSLSILWLHYCFSLSISCYDFHVGITCTKESYILVDLFCISSTWADTDYSFKCYR